jgi:hypothetical protein
MNLLLSFHCRQQGSHTRVILKENRIPFDVLNVLISKSLFTKYVLDVLHPGITPLLTYLFTLLVNYLPYCKSVLTNTR